MRPSSRHEPAQLRPGVRRVVDVVFFGLVPLIPFVPVAAQLALRRRYVEDGWFFDAHWLWVGWRHVAHGTNPYPAFLYPAPAAVIPAPLGFLGYRPAVITWSLILVGAILVALRVAGVRDWRCFGLVLLSMPAYSSIHIGTPTPFLLLATACAWRYRDRPWAVSTAVAFAVGFKVFLWPLLIWLAVTRFRTSIRAGIATVALVAGCWAVIGFAGASGYLSRLGGTVGTDQFRAFSVVALAHLCGLGAGGAHVAGVVVGIAAVATIVVVGRRRSALADRNAFIAAVGASLLASPVVWGHYFLLVYAAFALTIRRFGIEWLAPLAFWVVPQQENLGSAVAVIVGLGLFVALLLWSARRDEIVLAWQRRRPGLVAETDQPIDRSPLPPRVGHGRADPVIPRLWR
jgi:glycosyl transferase family 87